jgi:hypothetical protein
MIGWFIMVDVSYFCPRLAGKVKKLLPTQAKKVAWLGLAQKGPWELV